MQGRASPITWLLAGAWLGACEPVCESWNVLRADLSPPTNRVAPPGALTHAAGGTRHRATEPAPEPFVALTAATLAGAPGHLRWSAQFDQHLLIVEQPLTAGATLTITTLDNSGRFTGGYEGFGWWAGDWALVPEGPPKAALYALFEEQPSSTEVQGTVVVTQKAPLAIDLDLSLTDKLARTWRVLSRARFTLRQNQEVCER